MEIHKNPACFLFDSNRSFDLPAVTNDNLRGVLVWHDDSRAGQSASVCVGVVWLKRLLSHANVKDRSHFKGVPVHKNRLRCSVDKPRSDQSKSKSNGRLCRPFCPFYSKKRYLLSARCGFANLFLGFNGSNVGVLETNSDGLSILHENTLACRHSSVLKVGIRHRRFLHVQLLLSG